jgi:membrane associated rhomboid family serine protease
MINRNDFQNNPYNEGGSGRVNPAPSGSFATRLCKYITFIFGLFVLINLALFTFTVLGFQLQYYSICPWPILHKHQYYRLITHHFFHADFIHIASNMIFFYIVGRGLEKKLGSVYFFISIVCSMIFISLVYITVVLSMKYFIVELFGFKEYNYDFYCSIGFSGILFSLFYLQCSLPTVRDSHSYFFGLIPIKAIYSPFCYLILIQLLNPKASFVGHLAGIVCGYLMRAGLIQIFFPRKKWIIAFEDRFVGFIGLLKRLNYVEVAAITAADDLTDLGELDKGLADLAIVKYVKSLIRGRGGNSSAEIGRHINLREDIQV